MSFGGAGSSGGGTPLVHNSAGPCHGFAWSRHSIYGQRCHQAKMATARLLESQCAKSPNRKNNFYHEKFFSLVLVSCGTQLMTDGADLPWGKKIMCDYGVQIKGPFRRLQQQSAPGKVRIPPQS